MSVGIMHLFSSRAAERPPRGDVDQSYDLHRNGGDKSGTQLSSSVSSFSSSSPSTEQSITSENAQRPKQNNQHEYGQWQVWLRSSIRTRLRSRRSLLKDSVNKTTERGMEIPNLGRNNQSCQPPQTLPNLKQHEQEQQSTKSCPTFSFFPVGYCERRTRDNVCGEDDDDDDRSRQLFPSLSQILMVDQARGLSVFDAPHEKACSKATSQDLAPASQTPRRMPSHLSWGSHDQGHNSNDLLSLDDHMRPAPTLFEEASVMPSSESSVPRATTFDATQSLVAEQEAILKQIQQENQTRKGRELQEQQQQRQEEIPQPLGPMAPPTMLCETSSCSSLSSMDRKPKAIPSHLNHKPPRINIVPNCVKEAEERGEKTVLFGCAACGQILFISLSIPVVHCPTCGSLSRADWEQPSKHRDE